MNSARRRLGTGPSTTRSTSTTATSTRLLPAERIEPDRLLGDPGQRDVVERQGRRTLGGGVERTPDAPGREHVGAEA